MDFDTPPRVARVLTIIEAADGRAWVAFYPETTNVAINRRWGSLPQDCTMQLTIDGPNHVVVARSVQDAMRIAADYWAKPRPNHSNAAMTQQKGLTP